jgi:hypothetical protein
MIAAPRELSSDQRIFVQFARKLPWVALSSIVVCGGIVMLGGYWFRKTADTAAAHKAYHRAKIEFELGRTLLNDVCTTSRRCCIAQCSIPRLSCSASLQSHLARIDALEPAGDDAGTQRDHEVWQVYHDEAKLWITYGKPK